MADFKLSSIEDAVNDFKEGKFVIVVDDEDRENEGDLIIAAEKITPEKVNFMLKNARGVLCAPITLSRADELDLPHQVEENTSMLGTPFTITVDKLEGCTTGVSAHDRACHNTCFSRSRFHPSDFWPSWSYQSSLCPRQRRATSFRSYRSRSGSLQVGRIVSCWRVDGDYE